MSDLLKLSIPQTTTVFVEVSNMLDVRGSMTLHLEEPGLTLREWLLKRHGQDFVDFQVPTVCNINGKWVLREDWDTRRTKAGDLVQFLTAPGYEMIFYVIVLIVVMVAAIMLMPVPKAPGQPPAADPVWKLSGQYNRNRPGEPIEVAYGRCRLWPSYAHRPFTRFEDHKQIQFVLICLGNGYFDIDEIRIEDTPIGNFPEIEHQLLEPGDTLTLFPDNVITVAEIGGIELFAPDQDDYPVDGWFGPFTVNPAGSLANIIEIDLVCPGGLYFNNDGVYSNIDAMFTFEAREIDDDGAPVGMGSWFELADVVIEDNTPQVRQYTFQYEVDPGRYEVRAKRTNDASGSSQIVTKTLWQQCRAFLPTIGVYEGVTCLAIKARASNNLNDNTRSRFNVIATRKLPVYVDGVWSDSPEDLVATRSPVMAFCDAVRADYSGALADSFLDMGELMAMEERLDELGVTFDWVVDQKATVLEILKTISRVGRCIPMMAGSRLFMVRDEAAAVPVQMFTPDNMFGRGFEQQVRLFALDEYDSTIVEYVDPRTFEAKEVVCALTGATTDNPERLKLPGCTSRDVAYREGMFISASRRYLRERVIFRTGLEGIIPVYGDLIAVSHDVPEWGTTGLVVDLLEGGDVTVLTLSEPITFDPEESYKILLRDKFGAPAGPYGITPRESPYEVLVGGALDPDQFPISSDREPLMFTLGIENLETRLCKVVKVKPGSDEDVEIECIPYEPLVYADDESAAPVE